MAHDRSKRAQLSTLTEPLHAAGEPYWTQTPTPPRERSGPGWYIQLKPGRPAAYLGHTFLRAVLTLRELEARAAASEETT